MPVLVTGSSGRVGRAAVAALSSRGHEITGFDMHPPPPTQRAQLANSITGNIATINDDDDSLRRRLAEAFEHADAVVHLAALPDDGEPSDVLASNITGVVNVIEACRQAAVATAAVSQQRRRRRKRLIFASSGKIFSGFSQPNDPPVMIGDGTRPRPRCLYAASKLFAEAAFEAFAHEPNSPQALCLRLGWCPRTEADVSAMAADLNAQSEYLSPRDVGSCIADCVEAALPEDLRFQTLFVQSLCAKKTPRFDTSPTSDLTGWRPTQTFPEGLKEIINESSYRETPGLYPRKKNGTTADGNDERRPAGRDAAETGLRQELAAAYRVFAMLGWEHVIHTHITCKLPPRRGSCDDEGEEEEEDRFLINPYGLAFDEVTASNLITVNAQGDVIDQGSTSCGINPAGFSIHSALHTSGRGIGDDAEIVWTMHTLAAAGVALTAQQQGLLPLSQFAMDLGEISYHSFAHATQSDGVCQRLVADLGPRNKCLVMRNHGLLTVGRSVGECFYLMYNLICACEVQVAALAQGSVDIVVPSKEVVDATYEIVQNDYTGVKFGELEWQAMKRRVIRTKGEGHLL